MSPAVPPLPTVTTIAFLPPGSGTQIVPSRSEPKIRYGSPEIDCEPGTVRGRALTTAFAVARLQGGAATGTASTGEASQTREPSCVGAPYIRLRPGKPLHEPRFAR